MADSYLPCSDDAAVAANVFDEVAGGTDDANEVFI
jgi:hypothetical protein